ncbi:MAG TPA: dolichyl-phosphate beta-glucosyltransferase [Anaerolineales bacterium]|nr:dolichyl-phosphate beta-glucosyltransferase [Anaerolineales bacterium]
MNPFLSVIIPAHNEEVRLPTTLRRVGSYLAQQPYASEVLVVENGSQDNTAGIVEEMMRSLPSLRLLREPIAGKGRAVRRGMLAASGDVRFMCDADLSMPIEQLPRFLPPTLDGYDIAIASREAAGAVRYDEPAHRHWFGRAFNLLVQLLVVPGIRDTQCGFKSFRASVAEDLFSVQRLDGWTFDVEVLFLARQRGYRVLEVPAPWYHVPGSRVRLVQDSLAMFTDLLRVRFNWSRGRYAPR